MREHEELLVDAGKIWEKAFEERQSVNYERQGLVHHIKEDRTESR